MKLPLSLVPKARVGLPHEACDKTADVLMAKGQNYDDFTEYPLPLRLVQTNNKEELISMVDSHEDKWSILNCVHSKSGDSPIIVASRHGHLELI